MLREDRERERKRERKRDRERYKNLPRSNEILCKIDGFCGARNDHNPFFAIVPIAANLD